MNADLVLEGGGVKGIAHIGAATVLAEHDYTFHRVAGTSAGAIAAAFIASYAQKDKPVSDIVELLTPGAGPNSIDYAQIPGGKLPIAGVEQVREASSLITKEGVFGDDYLWKWVHDTLLRETGVETFGDLRFAGASQRQDLGDKAPYRLVVMVADISRGSLVRLPWDYPLYGLDPDKQLVADAVVASASIPFFFTPVKLHWANNANVSYWVDGGSVSDFPIEVFDRTDSQAPRWPTLGIKLQARPDPDALINNVSDLLTFAEALLETCVNGNDQVHLADPCVAKRTMFVDTSFVQATDFSLTAAQQQHLFSNGQQAANDFLKTWDWEDYQSACGGDPASELKAKAARGF